MYIVVVAWCCVLASPENFHQHLSNATLEAYVAQFGSPGGDVPADMSYS